MRRKKVATPRNMNVSSARLGAEERFRYGIFHIPLPTCNISLSWPISMGPLMLSEHSLPLCLESICSSVPFYPISPFSMLLQSVHHSRPAGAYKSNVRSRLAWVLSTHQVDRPRWWNTNYIQTSRWHWQRPKDSLQASRWNSYRKRLHMTFERPQVVCKGTCTPQVVFDRLGLTKSFIDAHWSYFLRVLQECERANIDGEGLNSFTNFPISPFFHPSLST